MSDLPHIEDGLAIARGDLKNAIQIITGTMGPEVQGVCLSYDEPWLYLKTRTSVSRAAAKGIWPLNIIVPASWAKRLARTLPAGDPIILHVDNDGRLCTNKFSVPCRWTDDDVQDPIFLETNTADDRLRRAAEILKPFRIEKSELQRLLEEVSKRGNPA